MDPLIQVLNDGDVPPDAAVAAAPLTWENGMPILPPAQTALKPEVRALVLTLDPKESLAAGLHADLEEIKSVVDAIPPAAIAEEGEWEKLARGLAHHAAIYKHERAQLYDILDAISKRAPNYDADENGRRFDRHVAEAFDHPTPITIATVYGLAKRYGWNSGTLFGSADAHQNSQQIQSMRQNMVFATRAVSVGSLPQNPPKREWLLGTFLMRGVVSLIVAPGARAKSTWLLTAGLSCASGRELIGEHVFGGPLKVLYVSSEDGLDELARRIRASMRHHNLTDSDVPGFHVIGAGSWSLPLLRPQPGGPVVDEQGWNALVAEVNYHAPDVLFLDPTINFMGGVDANDNAAVALLIGRLAALAAQCRIAIMLAHHSGKGRDPKSQDAALGAVSFVNLARIVLGIEALDEKAAATLGVPPWQIDSIFRIIGTKQNFSKPSTNDKWYEVKSVMLDNQQPPIYAAGDSVAVIERFTPRPMNAVYSADIVRAVLATIDTANPPLCPSKQSHEHALPRIANAIAPYREGRASESEAESILKHLETERLVEVVDVVVRRHGKGPSSRRGLALTSAGAAMLQNLQSETGAPESPETPGVETPVTAAAAVGDPQPGPPGPQGGVGGRAGGPDSGSALP